MIPNILEKQFSKVTGGGINRKTNKKNKESKKERLERISKAYGFSHGKGKRKKRSKKRGGSK